MQFRKRKHGCRNGRPQGDALPVMTAMPVSCPHRVRYTSVSVVTRGRCSTKDQCLAPNTTPAAVVSGTTGVAATTLLLATCEGRCMRRGRLDRRWPGAASPARPHGAASGARSARMARLRCCRVDSFGLGKPDYRKQTAPSRRRASPRCWPTTHILPPWNRRGNSSKDVETRLRLRGWRRFGRDSTRSPRFRRRDRRRPRLRGSRRCPREHANLWDSLRCG
jgi:hypothetical protein